MFTLVPGLVCTWLVDVPSAHAPRRNEYRRLQTVIQTYDPVYNNWVERSGFPNPMLTIKQKGGMFIMEHNV